ncbi:MAG: hypothetical protein IPG23_08580 [Burkholderiales bacterium]|nr:hypothetical protein [Burkholderiales bacterium]
MNDRPSFNGFRSPDGTRRERIASYREQAQEYATKGDQSLAQSFYFSADCMEGDLGLAWDKLAHVLSTAKSDPVIAKNPTCVELLEILCSIAKTVDGTEDIDGVLSVLEPVIASRNAWVNSLNSKPSSSVKWWVLEEWRARPDVNQSKRAFARVYRPLVKKKFDVLITEETIYRDWLPKGK